MTLGWPWPSLRQDEKLGNLGLSTGKSENCWFFFRTFAACDLGETKWRYVSIEGQGQFLTLAQGHLHLKIKTGFSQKWLGHLNQILFCAYTWSKY